MWLFPGMFQQPDPAPLGQKGEKFKTWVKVLVIFHLMVGISEIFLISPMKGIFEVLTAVILYCGMSTHNVWMILLYNIMLFFNAVQLFAELGLYVQNEIRSKKGGASLNKHDYSEAFFISYLSFLFVFYIVAITISFFFYREWKQANYVRMNGGAIDSGGKFNAVQTLIIFIWNHLKVKPYRQSRLRHLEPTKCASLFHWFLWRWS